MASEFQRGRIHFTVKESTTEMFVAFEPVEGTLPVLNGGIFSLALRGRPTYDEVKAVTKYLNEHVEELTFLPGSADVVFADFGNR